MPLPSTMTPIATNTLTSATASMTFSNIPQNYTDLFLVGQGFANSETYYEIQFNGDTGNNYSFTSLYGTGSVAASGRTSNTYAIGVTRIETNSAFFCNVINYSNSTTFKTALARNSNAGIIVYQAVGLWRSTSAITSVTLKSQIVNFNVGSTLTLYGIKAA